MDPKEEALELLNRVWYKLQNLPNATPIDLGAFFVILTFICESSLSIITHVCVWICRSWLRCFHSPPCSGGRAHVGADLRDVLLSQDEDEEVGHLSGCVKLKKKTGHGAKTSSRLTVV